MARSGRHRARVLVLVAIALLAPNGENAWAAPGDIVTIAGGASGVGDGGPATSAIVFPQDVAADSSGNLFIAAGNRIRKVDPSGTITTLAGNDTEGFSGDGGPATSATLALPAGVALDAQGSLLIADWKNHRIRKVDASGVITTMAGTGTPGYSGNGGPATSANLSYPAGIAVDAQGNVFISETANHVVRRIDVSGVISTVAGTGEPGSSGDGGSATGARLAYPEGIALDAHGDLFVADTSNHRIRKIDAAGTITTAAGDGSEGFSGDGSPAVSARLAYPRGVAWDAAGDLFIADTSNNRIRRVDTEGTISTVAGTGFAYFAGDGGPATQANLSRPTRVAVDASGGLLISETGRVRRVDATGTIGTVAGTGSAYFSGDGGPATGARLSYPMAVAVDGQGNVFIADRSNYRIRRVDVSGTITTVAGNGVLSGVLGDGGPATSARLYLPQGIAVNALGELFIADTFNFRIRKVDAAGRISTFAGTGGAGFSGDGGPATAATLSYPSGVAVDAQGNVLIADSGNSRIRMVDSAGTITTVAGGGLPGVLGDGGAATSASLSDPEGIAVDAAGDLFIADTGNSRVRKVDASGTITTVAGRGDSRVTAHVCTPIFEVCTPVVSIDALSAVSPGDGLPAIAASVLHPRSVAVDAAGNLFIADTDHHRIRQVDASGAITTVAGTGNGFSGDGGPATSARLYSPSGVALDVHGNLLIADSGNDRVREVVR